MLLGLAFLLDIIGILQVIGREGSSELNILTIIMCLGGMVALWALATGQEWSWRALLGFGFWVVISPFIMYNFREPIDWVYMVCAAIGALLCLMPPVREYCEG